MFSPYYYDHVGSHQKKFLIVLRRSFLSFLSLGTLLAPTTFSSAVFLSEDEICPPECLVVFNTTKLAEEAGCEKCAAVSGPSMAELRPWPDRWRGVRSFWDSSSTSPITSNVDSKLQKLEEEDAILSRVDALLAEQPDKNRVTWTVSRKFKRDLAAFIRTRLPDCNAIVELGVYGCGTTAVLAQMCHQVYGLDNNDFRLVDCNRNVVLKTPDNNRNIALFKFESWFDSWRRALPTFPVPDLIFIDANHRRPFVRKDLEEARATGTRFIVCDDYGGHRAVHDAVAEFVKSNKARIVQRLGHGPVWRAVADADFCHDWEGVVLEVVRGDEAVGPDVGGPGSAAIAEDPKNDNVVANVVNDEIGTTCSPSAPDAAIIRPLHQEPMANTLYYVYRASAVDSGSFAYLGLLKFVDHGRNAEITETFVPELRVSHYRCEHATENLPGPTPSYIFPAFSAGFHGRNLLREDAVYTNSAREDNLSIFASGPTTPLPQDASKSHPWLEYVSKYAHHYGVTASSLHSRGAGSGLVQRQQLDLDIVKGAMEPENIRLLKIMQKIDFHRQQVLVGKAGAGPRGTDTVTELVRVEGGFANPQLRRVRLLPVVTKAKVEDAVSEENDDANHDHLPKKHAAAFNRRAASASRGLYYEAILEPHYQSGLLFSFNGTRQMKEPFFLISTEVHYAMFQMFTDSVNRLRTSTAG